MKAYYHNTDATKPNTLFGYIDAYGDFLEDKKEAEHFGIDIVGEVYVEQNWLACEPLEDFKRRIAKQARKAFGFYA